MKRLTWKWIAQCVVVLVCAFALKRYYSTASANELRWILAPTTTCVELVSGTKFEFESHAGYINGDRSFLIATSCAGVNFLITAFLMLSAKKLITSRSKAIGWRFIPAVAGVAYVVTLLANTTRIAIALRLQQMQADHGWLSPTQVHRFEGIFVYFIFLLSLFVISERMSSERSSSTLAQAWLPLVVYYATMLGIPLANGAYKGPDFLEYSLFVLLIPMALILATALFRYFSPPKLSLNPPIGRLAIFHSSLQRDRCRRLPRSAPIQTPDLVIYISKPRSLFHKASVGWGFGKRAR